MTRWALCAHPPDSSVSSHLHRCCMATHMFTLTLSAVHFSPGIAACYWNCRNSTCFVLNIISYLGGERFAYEAIRLSMMLCYFICFNDIGPVKIYNNNNNDDVGWKIYTTFYSVTTRCICFLCAKLKSIKIRPVDVNMRKTLLELFCHTENNCRIVNTFFVCQTT